MNYTYTDCKILSRIHESANSLVYRAIANAEKQPVILKLIKQKYPTATQLTCYRQEYEIIRSLNNDNIIKAYNIARHENGLIMFLEDIGGESLKYFLSQAIFSLNEFISIAIKVTRGLAAIHADCIIHKDINPSNIVYNSQTGQLKIVDFGLSDRLSREFPTIGSPQDIEGTLAYIAPEQTGRINRAVDYRSDFYSLGVTFYEILTNKLPFETNDPMELIHHHIAQRPLPVCELNPNVPLVISELIDKLLSKTPENRYQTAEGILFDLETCERQLKEQGQISGFTIGSLDFSGKLQIPQKLYGREAQVAQLLRAFEKVNQGRTGMVLVSGFSGIGKSALVNEIHQPISQQRGHLISGKFDLLERDIPYAAIVLAFQELIRRLLSEPRQNLEIWKKKIIAALGENGQVIIDIIPEVEQIIGQQQPVEDLGATNNQYRFNLLFKRFLAVFCQKEHPLAIFLDDLQWADIRTLDLIEQLILEADNKYFLLIGAYRDNEVNVTHPLMHCLEKIERSTVSIERINLLPLDFNHINQLIADTLSCLPEIAEPLAELVFKKTEGNPFFISQLLESLWSENLLVFERYHANSDSSQLGHWRWNIEEIESLSIADNVVELMVKKIEKLDYASQRILKLAACIGNTFNLTILSIVAETSSVITARQLQPTLEEGLIIPLKNNYKEPLFYQSEDLPSSDLNIHPVRSEYVFDINYKFLHDRVQQAAYSLISETEAKEIHLQIGRLLLKEIKQDELQSQVFEVVNHLNKGSSLITAQPDKIELALLNLQAAKQAKSSIAYAFALKYLEMGINLLSKNTWDEKYDLTLELHVLTLEILYLNGKFERAKTIASIVLKKAKNILEKVQVYNLKINFYRSQLQLDLAIKNGLEILNLLGLPLSKKTGKQEIALKLRDINLSLAEKQIEELENAPELKDAHQLAVLSILSNLISPAYANNRNLYHLVVINLFNIHFKQGNSVLAPIAYVLYGSYLCETSDNIDLGYEFGQLSLRLLQKSNVKQIRPLVLHMFYGFIQHWKQDATFNLKFLVEGIKIGLECGEITFSNLSAVNYCYMLLFYGGDSLQSVSEEITKYKNLFATYNNKSGDEFLNLCEKFCLHLSAPDLDTALSEVVSVDWDLKIERYQESKVYDIIFFECLFKYIELYFLKNVFRAKEIIDICGRYKVFGSGTILIVQHNFYESLIFLAVARQANCQEQQQLIKQVLLNQKQLKKWGIYAPMNSENKYNLVEAEKARTLGKILEAIDCYEKAIRGAKKSGFIHEEALAYECAAEFYLSLYREEIGQLYLRNAYSCYRRWGATAKLQQLEEEYPQYLIGVAEFTQEQTLSMSTSTTSSGGKALDLNTIVKASQTISGEIGTEKLLQKLMKIVIENAGAQKGFLILENQSHWAIEAEGAVDVENIRLLRSLPIDAIDPEGQTPLVCAAIVNYVSRTQESIVLNDATQEGQFINDSYILAAQPKSILCAPIVNQSKLIGIVYLENNLITGAFTADRLAILNILSAQASISIENAQLYQNLEQKVEERTAQLARANAEITVLNERLKAENLRMSAELEITRRLQQILLPKPAELEAIPGIEIAGFMEPAKEVGGDYYDVLTHGDKATIGIGDVTGHGLESGVLTIVAQTAIRTLLTHSETDPVKFLQTVNQTLFDNVERMNCGKNMSLSLLEYQDKTLRLSGQHEEMIIVRNSGEVERIDTIDLGFPIGLEADITDFIGSTAISLDSGDVVVLYTDGITEAFDINNTEYGIDRLIETVVHNREGSATEIKQAVIDDVRGYIGEQNVFDDITLVVIKQKRS